MENLQFEILESRNLKFLVGILCIFIGCSWYLCNILILGGGSLSDQSQYRKRPMMVQEEKNQMCSNSSISGGGGGCGLNRSSKKMKQKRMPQRGLGVAQLERLRIEEQQKKDAVNSILSSPPKLPPINPSLAVPFLNFAQNQSSASSTVRPPSPTDLPSPNSVFRPAPFLPNTENFHFHSLPPFSHTNSGGFDVDWPSLRVPTGTNFPARRCPCEFREDSKPGRGLPLSANMSLPLENNPIGPSPDLMPKAPPYQQSPSLVNVSSMDPSFLNVQIEPPSNQSYYSTYASLGLEKEKMVGMKRSRSFPLDNPPAPPFLGKYPPISHFVSRSDESTSSGNGSIFNLDNVAPIFREVPPCPKGITEPCLKVCRENVVSSREFLTLAPPAFTSPRFKHTSMHMSSHNREFYDLESLPYLGSAKNPVADSTPGGLAQRPFFRFFPPSKVQVVPTPTNFTSCNGSAGESVDLDLKL